MYAPPHAGAHAASVEHGEALLPQDEQSGPSLQARGSARGRDGTPSARGSDGTSSARGSDGTSSAIPGERQNSVTTVISRLPFRKHRCTRDEEWASSQAGSRSWPTAGASGP